MRLARRAESFLFYDHHTPGRVFLDEPVGTGVVNLCEDMLPGKPVVGRVSVEPYCEHVFLVSFPPTIRSTLFPFQFMPFLSPRALRCNGAIDDLPVV